MGTVAILMEVMEDFMGTTVVAIQDQSALPFMTGRTTAVLGIGQATHITSGSLAIGCIKTVRKSGDAVITSCADID